MLREDVVCEMLARLGRGEPVKTIAREVGVDKKTVKRWRQRGAWQPRATPVRPTPVDAYRTFLTRRGPEAGHERALRHFGGVPLSCLYDNPRTITLGRAAGLVLWHPRFEDFARYYGFTPRACQPYRARTKGKVESGVKYVKRNARAGRRFLHWAVLEAWLEEGAATVADVRVHGTTHERPIDRFGLETLTPLGRQPPYHYEATRRRIVAAAALVAIAAGRYSVPVRYVGQTVDVRETATHYVIVVGDTPIAQHVKAGRHAVVMEPAHYQGLLRPGPLPSVETPRWDPAYQALESVAVRDLGIYDAIGGGQ